jgi:hypothetical protein
MLVNQSGTWQGTVGLGLTREAFAAHVAQIRVPTLAKDKWQPEFITLHNTAAPSLKQWLADKSTEQRLKNITAYYIKQGWLGGPHLFIDPFKIWLFCPLDRRGTHSPSFNTRSWGIEMVGDYDKESFSEGKGAMVRDNTVFAIATLLKKLGKVVDNKTLRLHREDPNTTHKCPGSDVSKADMIARIQEAMANG